MPRVASAGRSSKPDQILHARGSAAHAELWMLERIEADRSSAPIDAARLLRQRTPSQDRALSNEARVNMRLTNRGA